MTVYKYLLKTTKSKKMVILVNLIMFFIIMFLNKPVKDLDIYKDRSLNLGVVDLCDDKESISLLEYLESKHRVEYIENNSDFINESIFLNKYRAVIIIKEDKVEIVANEMNYGDRVYLKNQINKFVNYRKIINDQDDDFLQEVLNETVTVEIIDETNNIQKINREYMSTIFNFAAYTLTSLIMSITISILSSFKDENLVDRINISGISVFNYEMQVYLGLLTVNMLITSIPIVSIGYTYRESLVGSNFGMYVLNTYVYSLSIMCFAYFIDNLIKKRTIKNGISIIFSLGVSFISGAMIPQEFISDKVLNVSKFFPTYYFINGNINLVKGNDSIIESLVVLLLFSITFIIMGIYFSKLKSKDSI